MVPMQKNGRGSAWRRLPTVTACSSIASSSARLHARRGAVELVQHDRVREQRARDEVVAAAAPGLSDSISWPMTPAARQVLGALDARVVTADGPRDDLRERRLADAGDVLDSRWPSASRQTARGDAGRSISTIARAHSSESARAWSRAPDQRKVSDKLVHCLASDGTIGRTGHWRPPCGLRPLGGRSALEDGERRGDAHRPAPVRTGARAIRCGDAPRSRGPRRRRGGSSKTGSPVSPPSRSAGSSGTSPSSGTPSSLGQRRAAAPAERRGRLAAARARGRLDMFSTTPSRLARAWRPSAPRARRPAGRRAAAW